MSLSHLWRMEVVSSMYSSQKLVKPVLDAEAEHETPLTFSKGAYGKGHGFILLNDITGCQGMEGTSRNHLEHVRLHQ